MKQLFIVAAIADQIITRLRKAYPESRVVFWDDEETDPVAIKQAANLTHSVVAEDGIAEQVGEVIGHPVIRLSQRDKRLAKLFAKARRINGNKNEVGRSDDGFPVGNGTVLFCPTNDTHVKMFEPITVYLNRTFFLLFDDRPAERARHMMDISEISYTSGGPEKLTQLNPSVVVLANDWYEKGRTLLERAHSLGIPTVCIQEGCLDFDEHRRMQWCAYPFIQGPIMLRYLDQDIYFATGNPRFDSICLNELPENPVVMLNSNFTYGIHEDQRAGWISDTSRACRTLDVEFFISQHPRDSGTFSGLPVKKSGPEAIHHQLQESTVVVTRFSTIVYEAMLSGRQVVYYNPHKERMRLFNEDQTGGLYKASDFSGLVQAIQLALKPLTVEQQNRFELFLDLHCGVRDGGAARRCASVLSQISQFGYPPNNRHGFGSWLKRKLVKSDVDK